MIFEQILISLLAFEDGLFLIIGYLGKITSRLGTQVIISICGMIGKLLIKIEAFSL